MFLNKNCPTSYCILPHHRHHHKFITNIYIKLLINVFFVLLPLQILSVTTNSSPANISNSTRCHINSFVRTAINIYLSHALLNCAAARDD